MVIGIDFDNTLIGYDEVFFNHALDLKLVPAHAQKPKKDLRDAIRRLEDGEIIWQKMQAFAYGKGIGGAQLNEGAEDFLKMCHRRRIKVYIVSHKTEYSHFDGDRVHLRQAALNWMVANRFFAADGLGLHKTQVYFEPTREQKISRLQSLGCTHFVDDLEEVFLEKSFPAEVEKILFAPAYSLPLAGRVREGGVLKAFKTWKEIHGYFFDG